MYSNQHYKIFEMFIPNVSRSNSFIIHICIFMFSSDLPTLFRDLRYNYISELVKEDLDKLPNLEKL